SPRRLNDERLGERPVTNALRRNYSLDGLVFAANHLELSGPTLPPGSARHAFCEGEHLAGAPAELGAEGEHVFPECVHHAVPGRGAGGITRHDSSPPARPYA